LFGWYGFHAPPLAGKSVLKLVQKYGHLTRFWVFKRTRIIFKLGFFFIKKKNKSRDVLAFEK
jgi:hypothetical protein